MTRSPPARSAARRSPATIAIGVVALLLAWLIVSTAVATRMMAAGRPAEAHDLWHAVPHAATRLAEAALQSGATPAATLLATEALSRAPEDPRALHLASTLVFDAGDRTQADRIMVLAARLGWRDAGIQRWVMERAIFDRQWPTAARAADALLRSDGDRAAGTAGMIHLLDLDDGRAAVADRIALGPDWGAGFLRHFTPNNPDDRVHFADLLSKLASRGALPAGYDAAAGAGAMLDDGQADALVARWRAANPATSGDPRTGVVDGGFDGLAAGTPAAAPFGWQVPPAAQATLSYAPRGPDGADMALTVEGFGTARRPALTQLLALRPGDYTLSYDARLDRGAPSDMMVDLRCAGRGAPVPLRARPAADGPDWQRRTLAFTVPAAACAGQTLGLLASGGDEGAVALFDAFQVAAAR